MVEGMRDQFIENDVIGNYNLGSSFLGRVSSRKRKRKVKKRRAPRVHKRKNKRHSRGRRSKKVSSRRGIKFTKNGQPYKIMPNGRARFLKKR